MILLVIVIGLAARLLLTQAGHNFDFDSYKIVSRIRLEGESVYANTQRYNYGPAWFLVLEAFRHIASIVDNWQRALRLEVAAFLAIVDLGIATVVALRYGVVRGMAFFLAPIAIFISGYHGQFDNVAILLGLVGTILWTSDSSSAEMSAKRLTGVVLLGASLVFKHILFLWPLWLALRSKGRTERALIVGLPYAIFGASFLPFLGAGGLDGVITNVFRYQSAANSPIWSPLGLQAVAPLLLVAALGAAAWFTRRLDVVDALGVYLVVLVVLSPAVVNQYLAIPLFFIVARSNLFTWIYVAVSTLMLLGHQDGLAISWADRMFPMDLRSPADCSTALGTCVHHDWIVYLIPLVLLAIAGGIAWARADNAARGMAAEPTSAG